MWIAHAFKEKSSQRIPEYIKAELLSVSAFFLTEYKKQDKPENIPCGFVYKYGVNGRGAVNGHTED